MANTYTQLLVQLVFAVNGRECMVRERVRPEVEKYIMGIIKNNSHSPLSIFCMPEHIHILLGLNPNQSVAEIVRLIKANSSKWINDKKLIPFKFSWQEGYGAFSYSRSHLDRVVNYILNQPKHHRKKTFREEYIEFLQKYDVVHETNYLFNWLD